MGNVLVKTPITINGRDPLMGADGKIQYKESVVTELAGKLIEKSNAKLPVHLKKIITPISEKTPVKSKSNDKAE